MAHLLVLLSSIVWKTILMIIIVGSICLVGNPAICSADGVGRLERSSGAIDKQVSYANALGFDLAAPYPLRAAPVLLPIDGPAGYFFGTSVAISGDLVVVGGPREDISSFPGSVYLFDRNKYGIDTWGPMKIITVEKEDYPIRFGISVALSDDVLAVGNVPGFTGRDDVFGKVHLYFRGSGVWQSRGTLTAADSAGRDRFGGSISMDGDILAVGACNAVHSDQRTGAVYLFRRNQKDKFEWDHVVKLTAEDAIEGGGFGCSVRLSGDTLVVGSREKAAYIFQRNQGGEDAWGQTAKLTAEDTEEDRGLGEPVAISGDTVVVGASRALVDTLQTGAAYIFERNYPSPDAWGMVTRVTASDKLARDRFGNAVAISGDMVYVGAYLAHIFGDEKPQPEIPHSGAVYIFARNQGGKDNWGEVTKAIESDLYRLIYDSDFGGSLAVSGSTVVIGAPKYDYVDGAAYILDGLPSVSITPSEELYTTESGGEAAFTVVLNTNPYDDVTIELSSNDESEGTVLPTSLIFNSNNWSESQTVTVTGVDDGTIDGNQTYDIVWSLAESGGPYSMLELENVPVTNVDDDVAAVNVTPTSGLTTTEAGGVARFSVVLTIQPEHDVSIELISSDENEGTISPAILTFTNANWDQAQEVTVTGVDDDVDDGDQSYSITVSPCVSDDTAYNGLDPADVALVNTDDDKSGKKGGGGSGGCFISLSGRAGIR